MRLIKNAMIIEDDGFVKKDILSDDRTILKIQDYIQETDGWDILDVKGAYLLPGLIDLNVRLANNILSKSNLEKLVNSARKGGVTTAVIMSDFTPRLDSSTLLDFLNSTFDNTIINLKVTAPLTNEKNDKLNNIATLLNNGATAIYGLSSLNSNIIKRGMQYAHMKEKPLFCFCYEPDLDDVGIMNEGAISSKLGLSGISKSSETVEVAKIAELSIEQHAPIVFQTLSTQRSLEIVQNVKKYATQMYSEVSIHHLIKNDTSCDGFNTYAKILPPLREEEERVRLVKEAKKGTIDILTSSHAPKSVLYKDVAFCDADFGMGSIEEFFSLAYTYLVKQEGLPMCDLIRMCSENPAKVLNFEKKGKIKVGYDADMFLFDANKKSIMKNEFSIYNNETLYGKITNVFVA
ncbi:amidohydrolase family protein [Sulfurospirillum sp. 1612]|uniref:amidohydrolase family protein n=1 Tax=Sulfurospirillum sp. 1612 TaxID=3094835 RepID=UPI002F923203